MVPQISQVTKIVLKKKLKATKCSDHLTISITAHTAKMAATILRGRMERKIEDVLREYKLEFRRRKGTRDVTGMLRITSERTLVTDKKLCACFTDWQKTFDSDNCRS